MKKLYYLILTFLFLSIRAFSQTNNSNLSSADYPSPIAPSPEAAALGKYGDIPVSLFSGVPNISIPIYSFKDGDIKVDIGLNYDASGIRVDQVATNVGLGWSLAAGGVITRVVRGQPDEYYYGVLPDNFNPVLPSNYTTSQRTSDYETAFDAVINNRDYERDTYFYNFMGNTGKFVVANSGSVAFLPANPNLKVASYTGTNYQHGFIITDDKGFQYYFTSEEDTNAVSNCATQNLPSTVFASAWYLSKIVSPNNYVVNFAYGAANYTIPASYQEIKYNQLSFSGGCTDLSTLNRTCIRTDTYSGLRVSRIYADDNHSEVDFTYAADNRLDLDYNGSHQGNSLASITLRNASTFGASVNQTLKTWNLTYGYFNSGTATARLKLLSVKEDSKQPYLFTYNESIPLPARLSLGQDYWGYYNGKENSTFIPPIPEANVITGADRNPDFTYMPAGSLASMKYPTGGHTDFEYEPHTNNVTHTTTTYVNDNTNFSVASNVGSGSMVSPSFHLPAGATNISFNTYLFTINYDEFIHGYLVDAVTNNLVASGTGESNTAESLTGDHDYKFRIDRDNTADAGYVGLSWTYPSTVTTTGPVIVYGGLRIKSVKNYDTDTHLSAGKFYNYNWLNAPMQSSGFIAEDSIKTYYSQYNRLSSTAIGPDDQCTYAVLNSSSISNINDGYDTGIGYRQVTETNTADGSNGRTIYNYMPTAADNAASPAINTAWCRGLLEEKTEQRYNSASNSYVNVHTTKNHYHSISNDGCLVNGSNCAPNQVAIPNWKITFTRPEETLGGITYVAQFDVEKTITMASIVQLYQTEEINYNADGVNAMNTVSNYTYANPLHNYATTIETNDSRGKILKTENTYVPDLVAAGTALVVHTAMNARNIIAPVLTQKVSNETDGTTLSIKNTSYYDWGSGILQPNFITSAYNGAAAFTNVTFNQYDNFGNVLTYTPITQAPVAYHWLYYQQYPVAECKNAATNEFYFEGFEESLASGVQTNGGHTGHNYLYTGGNYTVNWTPPNGRGYVISYWYRSGGIWTYAAEQPYSLIGSAFTLTGGDAYDDIRIYPADAQLTSYTFDPQVGMTSATDAKGITTYYEYDSYMRLINVKDHSGNIVKHTDYHYQNQ
jgi:hypothetical protein